MCLHVNAICVTSRTSWSLFTVCKVCCRSEIVNFWAVKLFPSSCHVKVSGCCSMYYIWLKVGRKLRIHTIISTFKVLYTSFMYGVKQYRRAIQLKSYFCMVHISMLECMVLVRQLWECCQLSIVIQYSLWGFSWMARLWQEDGCIAKYTGPCK